jgi:hypothetical protein
MPLREPNVGHSRQRFQSSYYKYVQRIKGNTKSNTHISKGSHDNNVSSNGEHQ